MNIFQRTSFIITITALLCIICITPVLAVAEEELPWNWVFAGSNNHNTFFGLGTRNPNLGENFGLELGFNSADYSPSLDLLYFFDTFDNISFNVGAGVFTKKIGADLQYNASYSGGVWYRITTRTMLGLGLHSHRGASLKYKLWF